jgi:predicted MFS family arabinose efflux permease
MTTTDSIPVRRTLSPAEWALVIVLALVNFTHILDFVIVMPLGERLMRTMHIDAQKFGLVVSAYGLAATVSGVLASLVADRFDRRVFLLVSYAGFILATAFCGLANTFELFLVARVLAGTFGGLAASAIMAVIADVIPDHRRGKAIGAVTSAFAVASVLGLPAGLFLAEAFNSYGVPFLAVAVAGVVVWVVAWVRLPSVAKHLAHRREHSALAGFVAVVKRPNHLRSFAFMFTLVLGTFTIIPFLAPHMQINCGRSPQDIPWIYAVAGVCTLVGMNVVGWLTDRVGKRPVFLVSAVATMVMTVVITNLPPVGFWGAAIACSLFMVVASGRVVPAQGMMLATADPKTRGAFTTLNAAVSHLATGVGPLISGAVLRTETVTDDLGVEHITRLDHYDWAGFVAVGFAAAALGLSFLLKQPAKAHTPAAVPTPDPRPEPSPA